MASSVHPSRAGFVCVTILAASLCVPARAAEFAGGTGEPDDPYQIATAGQLLSLGTDPNLRTKHFILVADIDLDPDTMTCLLIVCERGEQQRWQDAIESIMRKP